MREYLWEKRKGKEREREYFYFLFFSREIRILYRLERESMREIRLFHRLERKNIFVMRMGYKRVKEKDMKEESSRHFFLRLIKEDGG